MDNIPSVLKEFANTIPEKEAFVFFNETGRVSSLTAKDVYVLSGRFANKLKSLGFQYGEVISNAIPNSAERLVTDFGIVMAGCIPSNCQIVTKEGTEFWQVAKFYQCSAVIVAGYEKDPAHAIFKQFLGSELQDFRCVDAAIPDAPSISRVMCVNRCSRNSDVSSHASFLDGLRQSSDEVFVHPDITSESLGYIFATSGTSGFSKPSARSQIVILQTGRAYERGIPTVRLCVRPLGWVGGYPFSFLANCSCVVIQDCFEGKVHLSVMQMWDVVETESCISSFMLPQEMVHFLEHFKENPPKRKLKAVVTGGQTITKEIIREGLGVLSDIFIVSYASTEMLSVTNAMITSPEQMEDFLAGHPMPGVQLRIVNEDMEPLGIGERGIILVKSPFGQNDYYNYTPPKPTSTEDGYFITGDRGWLDEQGRLFVSDRHDDVISHGSVLVYPSWPESMLTKLADVIKAVVLGIPRADGAHDLCACVVLHPKSNLTKDALISAYNNLFLDAKDEFVPTLSYVEVFSFLPSGSTGKVDKRQLRDLVMKRIEQSQ